MIGLRLLATTFGAWPRRRWLAAAVLAPLMGLLFSAVGGAGVGGAGVGGAATDGAALGAALVAGSVAWWDAPVLAITAVLAGLILASYVPASGSGRLVEVGCSPCAVVAAATVAGTLVIRTAGPLDVAMAGMSVIILVAGLAQRLKDATSCTT